MSADNGIYVLFTLTEDDVSEYRVAYAQAIDNIYGKWNEDTGLYDGSPEYLKEIFGPSEVFNSLDEALDKAEEMVYNHEYLEDGICVISDFNHMGHVFKGE